MSFPTGALGVTNVGGVKKIPTPIFEERDPTTTDIGPPWPIQQTWVNTLTQAIWVLEDFNTSGGLVSAQWRALAPIVTSTVAPTTADYQYPLGQIWIDTVTKIIYILVDVTSSVATWDNFAGTVSDFPITPYVVGPAGQADYQTIQDGIDAANAAGGGVVYVQPGSYTEDLTLYDGVDLYGTPA